MPTSDLGPDQVTGWGLYGGWCRSSAMKRSSPSDGEGSAPCSAGSRVRRRRIAAVRRLWRARARTPRQAFLIDQVEVLDIAVADLKLGDFEPLQLIEQRTPQAEGKRELRAAA